ncbi:MAG: hypothetical protein HAW67_02035 [Endozoicomonadaceae bacterium]|nr:hypothetical protein [Endozoicomonadaceae bacterium]
MSESEEQKQSRFASAIAEIAHSQLGYLVGFGIMIALIGFNSKWDGHFFDRKGCVEVQERAGKFFKVDTCDGTVEELDVKPTKKEESISKS